MFAILICARDEEKVISGLLESIAKQSYEPAYYDVFLVADHCTDKTVEKASDYSFVKILERTEKGKEGKGAALEWALNIIRE